MLKSSKVIYSIRESRRKITFLSEEIAWINEQEKEAIKKPSQLIKLKTKRV
nr:hypothetical protein [Entomoplasma sp. MP1]